LVNQTAQRIHNVMDNLRPPALEEYGLVAALRWYGTDFAARTNICINLPEEALVPPLPAAIETALFRVAQEALTNVARHAQASQSRIMQKLDVDNLAGLVRFAIQHGLTPPE
jgi:two-component system sensor histidine kinase UhpB